MYMDFNVLHLTLFWSVATCSGDSSMSADEQARDGNEVQGKQIAKDSWFNVALRCNI